MKAIMYHYIREYDSHLPFFKFLDLKNFRLQLDYFEKEFGFVTIDEFKETILNKNKIHSNKVVLTFDDGLNDHYKYVFPELVKRNLWGIFYVPTLPFSKHKFLAAHIIHLLSGSVEISKLNLQLESLMSEEMIPDMKVKEFREETYKNQNNSRELDSFKRILNYYMNYSDRDLILKKLIVMNNINVKLEAFYLKINEIKEMENEGMMFGSHSESHPVMSKLKYKEQEDEVKDSFYLLDSICSSSRIKTFCLPYGGFHSFNSKTIEILNKNNCDFTFSVESRDIDMNDLNFNIQSLPRYDCNEFKFGSIG